MRQWQAQRSAELASLLERSDLPIVGRNGLFVLARHAHALSLAQALARRHILVRTFEDRPALLRFGLCAADLTARTGSIGAAWGFHFANNVVAILVVSLSGTLSGLALYITPFAASDTETLVPLLLRDMATTVAIWAAIRFALAKTGR